MRLLITFVIVCLAVTCSARPQEDEYEYDDAAAAPVQPVVQATTKAPGRLSLPNSRQARGPSPLLNRGGKTTAAPPPPAKVQEPEVVNEPEEVEDEDFPEEAEVPVTTTVAPKKPLAPVVRPFRSNQDLLAALKRRRQQEQQGGSVATHATTPTTAATPATDSKPAPRSNSNNNSNNGRRTFNRANKAPAPVQEVTSEVEAPKKPALASTGFNRRFSARGKTTAAPPPSADEADEEVEEVAPKVAPKSYRGSKRL